MTPPILSREQVAERFAVPARVLIRYERRGLVRVIREGHTEGYTPDQVRRLWTIVSLQRELGVNLAGVEAILQLRSQVDEVHRRLKTLTNELLNAFDEFEPRPPNA
jgi:MerR family transcriptional regulator, heat shock protein HspR